MIWLWKSQWVDCGGFWRRQFQWNTLRTVSRFCLFWHKVGIFEVIVKVIFQKGDICQCGSIWRSWWVVSRVFSKIQACTIWARQYLWYMKKVRWPYCPLPRLDCTDNLLTHNLLFIWVSCSRVGSPTILKRFGFGKFDVTS